MNTSDLVVDINVIPYVVAAFVMMLCIAVIGCYYMINDIS